MVTMAAPEFDLVIRSAKTHCATEFAAGTRLDVAVVGGKIAAVELPGKIPPGAGRAERDCSGSSLLLCPGLIDIHAHIFPGVMAGSVEPDEWCLRRCTTTAVDAGSAGANTIEGFVKYVARRCATRCLAFINVGNHGLASMAYGHPEQLQTAPTIARIEKYRDTVVGVKLLLTASYANDGQTEYTAYQRALEVSAAVGLPLMTHHSSSIIPLDHTAPRLEQHELSGCDLGCPSSLRPGDIYTHCFHGFKSTIIDGGSCVTSLTNGNGADSVLPADAPPRYDDWHVSKVVTAARARGVLFDIGHGQGSFSWTVAEIAAAAGFFPDTISTDIHFGSNRGPCYDMQTAMTKLLMVGMPLDKVIEAGTTAAAAAIGWGDRIGRIAVGMEADLCLLELCEPAVDLNLEDCQGQLRNCRQRLVGRAVWKAGEEYDVIQPEAADSQYGFPSARSAALGRPAWEMLVVRDPVPPPPVAEEFREMIEERLAAIANHVEASQQLLLARPSMGDGNSNVPFVLSLPSCAAAKKGKTAEEPTHVQPPKRLLISFPEQQQWLEALRQEAHKLLCC